jgi:DmsE family decaheme c-type cytochrome
VHTSSNPRHAPWLLALAASIVIVPHAAAQGASNTTQSQAASPAAAAAQTPVLKPGYVGSEACKLCHEEIYNRFIKSTHFAVETNRSRGWQGTACESCHGPGAKHAEAADPKEIQQPAKLPPVDADATCLGCHRNQTNLGRIMAGHAQDTVPCYECHSVHGEDGRPLRLRKAADINNQCAACHTSVWAAFQKPYKHRLPEGAMSCTNCHNPHASFLPQEMRVAFGNEPTCFQCHSDKRGPFVFEHAPVRFEGCMACHEPHGSANPRMLIRHEVRLVCLECHANNPPPPSVRGSSSARLNNLGQIPPAFHDLRSPRFQNCTVCHVRVHGSYIDRNLER